MQDTFTLAEKFISLVCNSDKPEPKLFIDEFFIYENIKNYRFIPEQTRLRLSLILPSIYSYDFGYHNLTHAFEVAKIANVYSQKLSSRSLSIPFLASIFHDAWRVKEITSDIDQVRHTINMLSIEFKHAAYSYLSRYEKEEVLETIGCTCFDGTNFIINPMNSTQELLRDADISMFISSQYPYLFSGLMVEMGRDPNDMRSIKEFALQQIDFLKAHPLFTEGTSLTAKRENYINQLIKYTKSL